MATYKSIGDVIQEIEYWLRLATFLHEPLKNALLAVLHNTANDVAYVGLPEDPIQLYQEFSKQVNLITQLVKKRVLQKDQVDLLLPPNDNKTYSSKFDVTLIVILIINFTTLQPPVTGWKDKNPPAHDRSKGANVIRGRQLRNFVHHTEPKDIDEAKFNQKWAEGTQIITGLGYQYDTGKLKTISLDPKHEAVLKSLFSFIAKLQTKHNLLEVKHDALEVKHDTLEDKHDTLEDKHDTLEDKHDTLESKHNAEHDSQSKLISDLTQQLNEIANEVQCLRAEKERNYYSNTSTGSCCLESVLEYISKEIKGDDAKKLLSQLNIQADAEGDLVDKLKPVPWKNIKTELEMLRRADIVKYITKNTLITRGLQNTSEKLREHYKIELIKCLVEQPLSSREMDTKYTQRENVYVDVVVLPSSTVDEEYTNSDRDFLMKQNLLAKSATEKAVDKIIQPQDEMIFMRGVAGIGKSSLIDMFTLKWAKNEISNPSMFDFVFKLTCRELNQILTEFKSIEHLLKILYPKIFCNVTLEDLAEVSDRVLIILDGLDELKDIYKVDAKNASSVSQEPFHQIICDLINPKSFKSMRNHKTIVCGRPKACEFLKNQFADLQVKTIEVCGFSHMNVQNYILNFFDKNPTKAKVVQDTIASSYNLNIMSTVPVFLWVICNVYSENLIGNPINTNTELYFYTCLILIRNHFQGHSHKYKNLLDIVNDQDIIDVVYSLMVLSVKTYMQNQVLFTDKDIEELKCFVHLEQTGFIVKCSLSNFTKSTFQFRHLILQEFLCGMYLCVTKGISPYLSNRELSSCFPTILGIQRIIQENKNSIFLQFYEALLTSYNKHLNFFAKKTSFLKCRIYNNFIEKNILKLPSSMVNDKTLYISTDDPHCREFLDSFKEANHVNYESLIEDAEIDINFYKDYKNILNLLGILCVTKVHKLKIIAPNVFNESGEINEKILQLYKMTAGPSMRADINLKPLPNDDDMECTCNRLTLRSSGSLSETVKSVLNLLENLGIAEISKLYINPIPDAKCIIDEGILQLYKMTAGPSMRADINLDPFRDNSKMECTCNRLTLHSNYSLSDVKSVLNLLENLGIAEISKLYIKRICYASAIMNEGILQLYKMTAGPSMRADINLDPFRDNSKMECTCNRLTLDSNYSLSDVKSVLNLLEKLCITKIQKLMITAKIFNESGNIDEGILRLYKMTAGLSMSANIEFCGEKTIGDEWMICTSETVELFWGVPFIFKNILNLLENLNIVKINSIDITRYDLFDAGGNVDEKILKFYEMTAGPSMRADINLDPFRDNSKMECTCNRLTLHSNYSLSDVKSVLNLLEKLCITKIQKLMITAKIFNESGNIDKRILRLYKMTAGLSMSANIDFCGEKTIDDEWMICTSETVELFLGVPLIFKNILNLLENLNIVKINSIDITRYDLFDAGGNVDENILKFYEMTAGPSMQTFVKLPEYKLKFSMQCTSKELQLYFHSPLPSSISLPDVIKMTTAEFYIDIKFVVLHHDAVSVFLQEITKHSIENCKNIWFFSSPLCSISAQTASYIKNILCRGKIDVTSEYIHFRV